MLYYSFETLPFRYRLPLSRSADCYNWRRRMYHSHNYQNYQ